MKIGRTISFCILLASLLTLLWLSPVLAQDEETNIELTTSYYKQEIISGESASFNVELNYQGAEARIFDLEASGPMDWTTYITPAYATSTQILDIRIEPPLADETYSTERIAVNAAPAYGVMPEPGEYQITVEASSGEIKGSIQLTVVVTAKYDMYLTPTEERYSTSVTAGRDNYFSVAVVNGGSAAIDDITFSTNKPRGWTVEFSQKEISSLAAGNYQIIDLNIKPPSDAIAGDYEIVLKASGQQASADDIDIRVTVKTPAVWGWVGVGIIVLVIAGLAFIFMRFSRR
jgi:uncharacterized membrane protein